MESEKNTKKREAYEFGIFSEEMVSREYIKRGYTVLERRWKMGKTEIDLIAQKNDVIVIIEVKARASDNDEAVDAMTRDKRKRMVRAADSFIKNLKGDYEYRFDVAACSGDKNNFKMEILEDAFLAADLF